MKKSWLVFLFTFLATTIAYAESCVDCHIKLSPGQVADWKVSKHFENDIGFGLKYYLYKTDVTKLSLSAGALYQFTSTDCSDPTTCEQEGVGRYSYRAKFSNETLSLVYYYQPNMSDNDDYITKYTIDLTVAKINEAMAILLSYQNKYRSLYGRSESGGIKLRIEY